MPVIAATFCSISKVFDTCFSMWQYFPYKREGLTKAKVRMLNSYDWEQTYAQIGRQHWTLKCCKIYSCSISTSTFICWTCNFVAINKLHPAKEKTVVCVVFQAEKEPQLLLHWCLWSLLEYQKDNSSRQPKYSEI